MRKGKGEEKKKEGQREVNLQKKKDKIVMDWILLPQNVYVDILTPQYPECNYIWR